MTDELNSNQQNNDNGTRDEAEFILEGIVWEHRFDVKCRDAPAYIKYPKKNCCCWCCQ